MTLKQTLIDVLDTEQLKELCNELEVTADRRSREAMMSGLASSKRAKPDRLIEKMGMPQLRDLLQQLGQSIDGRKEELVARALAAGGRADNAVPIAGEAPAGYAAMVQPTRRGRPRSAGDSTEQYLHKDEAVQRPDAGVQDQFQAKKPPRTYRYDSSLDPALSWDEQRERDSGSGCSG